MTQAGSVFTVFFCGTGSTSFDFQHSSYPNGELVSTLANNHEGMEFIDWIIVDGPGSGNLQEDEKWVKPGNYGNIVGQLMGKGWQQNVAHAVAMIKGKYEWNRTKLTSDEYEQLKKAGIPIEDKTSRFWSLKVEYPNRIVTPQELQAKKAEIFRKGKLPTVVNLIGWSRGGVSCHMLAHAMFQDELLKNIPVNIFAIDPVPGMGNFQENRTSIPSNVDNYVAVYARDERSKGFAPTVPKFLQKKKPIIMPVPGRHATLVGNGAIGKEGKQELFDPGKLVRDLAEKYLTSWGTNLTKKLKLVDKDIVTLYGYMVKDAEKYKTLHSESYTFLVDEINKERSVGKGSDWTSTKFSDIKGTEYLYPEGLAPVDNYLSWHHKQVSQKSV